VKAESPWNRRFRSEKAKNNTDEISSTTKRQNIITKNLKVNRALEYSRSLTPKNRNLDWRVDRRYTSLHGY